MSQTTIKKILIVSIIIFALALALLFAAKYYREHTSYLVPEPWWMARWLRMSYAGLCAASLATTLGAGVTLLVAKYKSRS